MYLHVPPNGTENVLTLGAATLHERRRGGSQMCSPIACVGQRPSGQAKRIRVLMYTCTHEPSLWWPKRGTGKSTIAAHWPCALAVASRPRSAWSAGCRSRCPTIVRTDTIAKRCGPGRRGPPGPAAPSVVGLERGPPLHRAPGMSPEPHELPSSWTLIEGDDVARSAVAKR